MNWFDANDLCKTEGGKLVEIDSKEENTALVEEMIKREYGWKNMQFWMGLTDEGSEGNWRLESNGMEPSYTNWGFNEPNNFQNEDCARFNENYPFKAKWIDTDCNKDTTTFSRRPLHPLCEFENSPTKSPLSEGI